MKAREVKGKNRYWVIKEVEKEREGRERGKREMGEREVRQREKERDKTCSLLIILDLALGWAVVFSQFLSTARHMVAEPQK